MIHRFGAPLALTCILGFCFSCAETAPPECARFCHELAECGFGATVFGRDRKECLERCTTSSPETRNAILDCKRTPGPATCHREDLEPETVDKRWCCNLGCKELASCIESKVGTAAVPTGTVQVRFSLADDTNPTVKTIDPDRRMLCSAGGYILGFDVESFCRGTDAEGNSVAPPILSATLSLDADVAPVSGPCDFVLGQVAAFHDVAPGATRAFVELTLPPPTGESSEACHVFWSPRVAVLPHDVATAIIFLPTREAFDCPDPGTGSGGAAPSSCPDASAECVRYRCERQPPACEDGCDNDGDLRTDCLDPHCAASPRCLQEP